MNEAPSLNGSMPPAPGPPTPALLAKARLLAWAEETDARALVSRSGLGAIAAGGALAFLGGVAIACVLAPRRTCRLPGSGPGRVGRRAIDWTLVARAGELLLPYAINAARSK